MTSPDSESTTTSPFTRSDRRTSKIARLTKSLRDQINTMIQDGVPYLQIIERAGPEAADITEQNLSTWRSGGYQDWLREQYIADSIRAKHELAQSIVNRSTSGSEAGQAVLQVIAASLVEFLAEMDPVTIRESLLDDADKFTRFVNSMVRLAEGGIKCDNHRSHTQDRLLAAEKEKQGKERRGISEEALRQAEEALNLL